MPFFASFTLTTPMMLWAGALAALPLAAHLLNRHANRRVVFPTIRLLVQSSASQSRLFRLRRWILLFLRCAFVALIAAAFARPLWYSGQSAEASSFRNTGLVLILDVSASTGQIVDGAPLIEQLRSSAARTLDSLTPGADVAAVVTTGDRTESVFPRLSPNLTALHEHLAQVTAGHGRSDFWRAFAIAADLLSSHTAARQVVLVSDLQRTAWHEPALLDRLQQLLPTGTQLLVLTPPGSAPENVALSAPRVSPPRPIVGQPSQCIVRVTNDSRSEKQVLVELRVDNAEPITQTMTLAAGEDREAAFETTFDGPNARTARFTIPEDGLADDNRAWLEIRPALRLPVLLISDDSPDEPGSGSWFLSRALAPTGSPDDRYDVRWLPPARVTAADLSASQVVFIDYVGGLEKATASAVIEHAKSGGGIVIFAGDPVMERALTALTAAADDNILPWTPGAFRDLSRDRNPLTIAGGQWRARTLRDFDEQSQLALRQIRFLRVFATENLHPEAELLLSFADGTAALARRPLGNGQLLVASFSADVSSSDFGKFGSFVALVQSLARELRPQADERRPSCVGLPWVATEPIPDGIRIDTIRLTDPADLPVPTMFDAAEQRQYLRIDHPDRPGPYRFQSREKLLATAAIHIDPRESRLERIDASELTSRFHNAAASSAATPGGSWEPVLSLRGRPVFHWLVAAAAAALAVELACVSWWRR